MEQNTDGVDAVEWLRMGHMVCEPGSRVSGKGYGAAGGIHHCDEVEEIESGDFLLLSEVEEVLEGRGDEGRAALGRKVGHGGYYAAELGGGTAEGDGSEVHDAMQHSRSNAP